MHWRDRLARVRQANDAQHGERLSAQPMAGSQHKAPAVDVARPAFTFTAVLRAAGQRVGNLAGTNEASWQSNVASTPTQLFVDPVVWPAARTLRKGDHLTALDRGDARFEILTVDRDQRARLVFTLGRIA